MKKRYERPSAYIEEFTPNEYVAACGDENKVYMFTCDAGGGKSGDVWLETNGKYQNNSKITTARFASV